MCPGDGRHDRLDLFCRHGRLTPRRVDAKHKVTDQDQVDAAGEFINVIYINALLDEAGFRPSNIWLTTDEQLMALNALHEAAQRGYGQISGQRGRSESLSATYCAES